jgi:hypothetical protein
MNAMRNLTTTHRLQALSVPEVTDRLEDLLHRVGRTLKFRGHKLRPGHVLNAVVLHFLSQSEEEQDRALAGSLSRLEAILGDDGPRAAADARPDIGFATEAGAPAAKKSRRKSG